LYANSGGAIAIGEASTTYTWYPLHSQVPERILDLIPDARFIYVLRDPIERMRSAYVHAVSLGVETRPIGEALLWNSGFLYPTMYALQIEQYLRHVDRSRLLLVSTGDFRSRREETLDRVFRFIGVDPQLPLRPGFEGPLNVGAGRRAPRRIARWATETARRSPLGRHVPEVPRYRPRRLLTKPILDQDAVVDPALRARLIDVLGPDLRRLTELANDEISADELSRWQT
jgi:hypothetical protein